MACFIVPAAEAVVTTVITKKCQKKDKEAVLNGNAETIPVSRKLSWLNNMLWGGSALLAFEHLWHGEITPFFPFLTAMGSAEDTMTMLHEMSTVGVSMALLVTAAWGIMCAVTKNLEKSVETKIPQKQS